jgi:hypothetical protein
MFVPLGWVRWQPPAKLADLLTSYGSYYPIMPLFQGSRDKIAQGFRHVLIGTFCTTYPYPVP